MKMCWMQIAIPTVNRCEVPFVNTILSHLDRHANHVIYTIDKDIVEIIFGKNLWNPTYVEGQIYENIMRMFTLDNYTSNDFVTIKTPTTYHLAIKYVDIGISFL